MKKNKNFKKIKQFLILTFCFFFIFFENQKNFKISFNKALKEKKLKKVYAKEVHDSLPDTNQNIRKSELSIAKKNFYKKNYNLAYNQSISLFRSTPSLKLKEEALLLAIQALEKLNLLKEALKHIDFALSNNQLFQNSPPQLYTLQWNLLLKSSSPLEVLHKTSFLIENTENLNLKEFYILKSKKLIESNLSFKDLKKVIRSRRLKPFHASAFFKLAYFLMNEKSFRKAKHYFKKVLNFEEEELKTKALNFIQKIELQKTVNPYNIGVLLPLSGKHSELSNKILHGLQMGFGIFDEITEKNKNNRTPFQISIKDSFGNPDLARLAVEKLLLEDQVISIIGSLLSKTAESTAQKANELGIPCISFSQKSNLTQIGPYIFRNALSSQMQIQKLVHFLIKEKNFKNFGVLFPNDAYGIELTNVFWDEVKKLNGQITAAQAYRPKETDFKNPIQRLVGLYDLQDREEEYSFLFTEWVKKQKIITLRKSPPDNLLKPIVHFDVLFVPDDTKSIGQIAPLLSYYDIHNVILAGTNLWNTPSLLKRGRKHIQGALFVDNQFNLAQSRKGRAFLKKYRKIFNEEPNLFSLRAYETAKILRYLIEEKGEKTRIGLKNKLRSLKKFPSILYSLDVNEKREIKQHLFVFTVSQGQITPFREL